MSDRRQKNQLELASGTRAGVKLRGYPSCIKGKGPNRPRRSEAESPAIGKWLMEKVCGWEDCKQELARIKANKGSPGVDRITVQQLPDHLKQHWPAIRKQLLSGTYVPQPVKRVRSRSRTDGMQAWYPDGLRTGRSAHQPVEAA